MNAGEVTYSPITQSFKNIRPKKGSGFWSYMYMYVIGWLQNRCGDTLFFPFFSRNLFFCHREIYDTYMYSMRTKFSMYKVWWLREALQIGQTFIPLQCMWKKSFKTQHGSVPIDPAILAAIGHRFIAEKKGNEKCWRTGLRRHARIPETGDFFLGGGGAEQQFKKKEQH